MGSIQKIKRRNTIDMGKKMKKIISCVISESLKHIFEKYDLPQNVDKTFIAPNGDFSSDQYNLLVLERNNEGMYSGKEFRSEKCFNVVAYYNQEWNQPEDLNCVIDSLTNILQSPGVISYQQIKSLMKLGILIYDGDFSRIRGASYDLVIDKEFLRSGVAVEQGDTIVIPPFDFVVVCARESANLPTNICGTFDLKVSMFCKGIILSNGPQVDPGYQGRLLCLLFNSSSVPFTMEPNADFEFATLQLQALSMASEVTYTGKYRKKKSVKDYVVEYARESFGERMLTIPNMQNNISELTLNIKELAQRHDPIENKVREHSEQISELKGSSIKWISVIAALIAAFMSFYSYYRLDSIAETLGELKAKVAYLSEQVNENRKTISQLQDREKLEEKYPKQKSKISKEK